MSRLTRPHVARNRDPIANVLGEILPPKGLVLEVGSGSGEHAVHFARRFPHLQWQPTDFTREALQSIGAWSEEASLPNLRAPLALDVHAPWPVEGADAVLCINMIHYSPSSSLPALMAGAAKVLTDGPLYLYGPYNVGGRYTAPSNERFDGWLKDRDPAFGIRDLEEVIAQAEAVGLALQGQLEMPANNLSVWFRRPA